jgi:hypothetical protein
MKGVLFTRRSPPEWGAYCTPILMSEDAIGILVLPTAALIGVLSGFIAR